MLLLLEPLILSTALPEQPLALAEALANHLKQVI
jgi:hypothetical protein